MFRTFTDVTRPPLEDGQSSSVLNRYYICDLCSEGWLSETEVEIHRSNTHSEKIADMLRAQDKHICKMCMTEFANEETLLCHIKVEHLLSSEDAVRVERDIFICSDCGDIFFNKPLLIHHILNSHMPKSKNHRLKCPSCLKNIRLNTCWYHFLQHKLQSVAVCKICLTKCKDRLTLAQHLKSHSFVYKCDMCSYITKMKESFNAHILTNHKKPDVHIEAFNDKWKRYFSPRKELKKWQRINLMGWKGVRLTNDVHICVLCREICIGVASMKRHILVDHTTESWEDVRPSHTCKCGMVFTSKVLFKHHLFKFHHENLYKFKNEHES